MKHLAILLALLTLLTLIIPKPVYADPIIYQSSPTTHTTSGGLKPNVTTPADAYDSNNSTSATFDTGIVSSGTFEVKSFSTVGAPTSELIAFVDFKMKYTAVAAVDDQYRIVYWVKPSAVPTVLVDWTSSAHSVPAAGCDVWTDQREPNDGTWSWTDVSNIRIVVETSQGGEVNDAAAFNEYEAWVSVYAYPQPTLYVDPATTVKAVADTFTIDINVTSVNDLYGWELQLSYNGTLLNGTSVTEGTFLSDSGVKDSYFNVLNFSDTLGLVWATSTLLGDIRGTTGGGVLATVSFKVKTTGSCALGLHDTKLVGRDENGPIYFISHDVVGGYVQVTGLDTEVAFSFIPNPVYVGQTVTLIGNLTDVNKNGIPGAQILLEFSTDGGTTWHPAGTLTTNATGWFEAGGPVNSVATFLMNASYSGSPIYRPSSSIETLIVTKMDTVVSFTLTPNPAVVNEDVTLLGNLTDSFNNPISGASVEIYYSADDGVTWNVAGALITNGTGWFGPASGPLSATGVYKIAIVYWGSGQYNFSYHIETLQVDLPATPKLKS